MTTQPSVRPMSLANSALVSAALALVGWGGLYWLFPALARAGVPQLWSYLIGFAGMLPLLLACALAALVLEHTPFSRQALASRLRLRRLARREWLWTLGLLVVYVLPQLLLAPTARWMIAHLPLPLPDALPAAIDPRVNKAAVPDAFLGVPLAGNWAIALLYLGIVVLNVVAEEVWWRGVVLPRQELAHGRWAWLVHGLLWTAFHLPMWWNLPTLLPSTLSLSFVTSRLKSTTPGLVAHGVMNGLGWLVLLGGVIGLGQ